MDAQEFRTLLSQGSPKVVVVGGGYVGLPLACEFAKAGCQVTVLDTDEKKISAINRGESYIGDVESRRIKNLVGSGFLSATDRAQAAYDGAHAVLICVPTPLAVSREPDVAYVRRALSSLGACSTSLNDPVLIVLESTVYPGFTREEIGALFSSSREDNQVFSPKTAYVVFSPERVDPASPAHVIANTPKVVGGMDLASTDVATVLYSRIVPKVVAVSSPDAAELVKLLENTFRAVSIATVNEFAKAAEVLSRQGRKVDIWEVVEAAATKPYGFMSFKPGPGCGGECLPCDPPYLSSRMRSFGHEMRLLDTALRVNLDMPRYVVDRIAQELNARGKPVKDTAILVVGVAYKANVSDTRESPAVDVYNLLDRMGAKIHFVDPHVQAIKNWRGEIAQSLPIVGGIPSFSAFSLAVITTDHADFDYQKLVNEVPLVFDTRNAIGTRSNILVPGSCTVVKL